MTRRKALTDVIYEIARGPVGLASQMTKGVGNQFKGTVKPKGDTAGGITAALFKRRKK